MTPEQQYLGLLTGRTIAFDLLLRALYAKWAAEQQNPTQFMNTTIENIIRSMWGAATGPASDEERAAWQAAETELRQFAANLALRFPQKGT